MAFSKSRYFKVYFWREKLDETIKSHISYSEQVTKKSSIVFFPHISGSPEPSETQKMLFCLFTSFLPRERTSEV